MKTSAFRSNRHSVAEDRGVLAECLHVHRGPAVALQSTNTTMPFQDFSHSEKHQLYYLKKHLRQIVEGLSFSKDLLEQQGPSYKEYNFKHLYDPSDIIQNSKSEKPIAMNFKRSVRLHPQKQPLFPMKNNGLSPKLRQEDSLGGSKLETLPRKLSLPPVPSCKTPGVQAVLAKPCERLSGSLTRGRQEKQISEKNIPGSENMTCGVEKTGLEKLNRTAPVDQQRARSGSVQCNPLDFEKQRFPWNTIRDELSSDKDVKILDNIQGRENDMEILSQTQAEKTPGTVLPVSCSGLPAYYPRVLSTDDPADTNVTADDTERRCLNPESSVQRHLIARLGKYTYTPKNAFERELYFGTAKIVHQVDEGMKDYFILENHDQYYKHLQQPFPRQPECWGCKPQRRAARRSKKEDLRWIALPTLTPYFVQNDKESPPTKAKEVQKESKGSNKEVPWEIQALRATLEQWKDAWNLRFYEQGSHAGYPNTFSSLMPDPQWRNMTKEGLTRSLTSVHNISRIKAIIACASAAVEQHGRKTKPQKLSERSSCLQAADLHVGMGNFNCYEMLSMCENKGNFMIPHYQHHCSIKVSIPKKGTFRPSIIKSHFINKHSNLRQFRNKGNQVNLISTHLLLDLIYTAGEWETMRAMTVLTSSVLVDITDGQNISSAAVTDSAGKPSVTQDVLAELQPLLRETLQDKNAHVRMASALCHYVIGKRNEEAQSIVKDALAHGNSADSWAVAQCLALESTITVPVVTKLLSRLFERAMQLQRSRPLGALPADSPAEQPRWTARARACCALPGAGGHLSQDLMNKLSQLMWKDWNIRVCQAATLALGHMKLAKEIHDQLSYTNMCYLLSALGVKLTAGNCQTKVQALSLIRQLQYMTAKLFPGFLQCFSSDFVAVWKEACLTAGALGIKEEHVLRCLYEMMQYDPHWIIKVFAIRALGQIGHVSPELKHLLLWAVHYEEEPEVRREACCCIARLCLQDENVQATLLERLILEPNETVREEVGKAMKILNFPHEEDQEMIKEIKKEIFRLSQKDLVTQKLLKFEKVMDWLRQKASHICWSREDLNSEREDILERITAVFQSTPGNSNNLSNTSV
ncbi:HEAT repeat-containing protein 4 [Dromaius novaehollandiae]|uniref:HEAT repeat-containing protein 4 n=1 Tax=Dromaius novaehollandiae TaxID=8790 RepID=UPI00311F4C83